MRFVVLSRRRQWTAVFVVAMFLGWSLYASVVYFSHDARVAASQARIAQIRAAYDQMVMERDTAAAQMRDAYRDLLASAAGEFGPGTIGFGGGHAVRVEGQAELAALLTRNAVLNRRVASLTGELAQLRSEREGLASAQQILTQQRDFLGTQLAELKRQNSSLAGKSDDLRKQLADADERYADLGHERQSLSEQLAQARSEIVAQSRKNETAASQLAALRESLAKVSEARDQVSQERGTLDHRVGELEQQLAALQSDQRSLIARLSERATMSNVEVERTIAMTGLDVNKLLAGVSKERFTPQMAVGGKGGPFVAYRPSSKPAKEAAQGKGRTTEIEKVVAALDSQEERREGLRRILARLPLAAPLDDYHLASPFGRRIDPINGRLAMHTGLDLTAEVNSPVFSTAPGKVVFAGWNGRYGKMVEIEHGMGIRTRYAHLRSISVPVGREVAAHTEIGIIGATGRATGVHIHYEVLVGEQPYDPAKFMRAGQYVFNKG